MVTTEKMWDEARGMDCGADGPSVQVGRDDVPGQSIEVGTDAYEDLRNATPEELLEAALWFYERISAATDVSFLKLGFALAGRNGWQYIAPMWLRESRKGKDE